MYQSPGAESLIRMNRALKQGRVLSQGESRLTRLARIDEALSTIADHDQLCEQQKKRGITALKKARTRLLNETTN